MCINKKDCYSVLVIVVVYMIDIPTQVRGLTH